MKHEATNAPDSQTIHETLYDGADVPVTYTDGRTEMVKVRKIPRSEFAQYSLLIGSLNGDESAECAFYCDKDEAWAKSLDDDSFDRVLAEGQRLNFTRYANWFSRQAAKMQLVKQQSHAIGEALELLNSHPTLKTLLVSTNGSSARDTATPISGGTRPTN